MKKLILFNILSLVIFCACKENELPEPDYNQLKEEYYKTSVCVLNKFYVEQLLRQANENYLWYRYGAAMQYEDGTTRYNVYAELPDNIWFLAPTYYIENNDTIYTQFGDRMVKDNNHSGYVCRHDGFKHNIIYYIETIDNDIVKVNYIKYPNTGFSHYHFEFICKHK